MINLKPNKCNLCGGDVIYISNDKIYGKKYGSGFCYYCSNCGAYVGTHINRPDVALGILANAQMRNLKMKCHNLFDSKWNNQQQRNAEYKKLAQKLNINYQDCHFGYFDLDMLNKALEVLKEYE